jgi:hypothetical protein
MKELDKHSIALLYSIIFINIIDVVGNFAGFWQNTLISRFIFGAFFSTILIIIVGNLLLDQKKTISHEYTTSS